MKQSNPNWVKELTVKLEAMESYEGKVGWFDNAKEEDGTPSAAVAAGQEYGIPSKNVPPRLGMRETVAKKERQWQKAAAHLAGQVMEGSLNPKALVETLVQLARRDFFKRINSNPGPPLKKKTLQNRRRRGNTTETTLIDTHRMIEGLETKVEKADDSSGV